VEAFDVVVVGSGFGGAESLLPGEDRPRVPGAWAGAAASLIDPCGRELGDGVRLGRMGSDDRRGGSARVDPAANPVPLYSRTENRIQPGASAVDGAVQRSRRERSHRSSRVSRSVPVRRSSRVALLVL
jgi:hypothetical protein